jgi:transposase-like protein
MSKKHKSYSDEFKFKVALAALKGNKTLAQISTEYQIAPSVIQRWKTLVQTMGAKLFKENNITLNISAAHEIEKAKLYQQIGQLTVEHEFLKKALAN